MPATRTVISGAVSVSRVARSSSRVSAAFSSGRKVVAEPISGQLETSNDSTSVWSCEASVRLGANGTVALCPASLAACSTAAHPPRTMRSASETCLPPDAEPLKSCWIFSESLQDLGQLGRLVDLPVLLGLEGGSAHRWPRPHVGAAVAGGRRPCGGDELETDSPESRILSLRASMSFLPRPACDRRRGRGPARAAAPAPTGRGSARGPMSRCNSLNHAFPGVREFVGMLVEAPGDRLVDRIHLQREVRRQHHGRVLLRRIVRIGDRALRRGVRGHPLLRTGGSSPSFVLVVEEVVEVPVVPLRGLVGPERPRVRW